MWPIRKLIQNHMVALTFVIPNLLINGATQTILDVYFHWTGYLSILAWMIGGGLSLEYGILLSTYSKSSFKLGKWKYDYSLNKREEKQTA